MDRGKGTFTVVGESIWEIVCFVSFLEGWYVVIKLICYKVCYYYEF